MASKLQYIFKVKILCDGEEEEEKSRVEIVDNKN